MKPTKLTKKPDLLPGCKGSPRGVLFFFTDAGNFMGSDLAKKLGRKWPSLYEHYRRVGWRLVKL